MDLLLNVNVIAILIEFVIALGTAAVITGVIVALWRVLTRGGTGRYR